MVANLKSIIKENCISKKGSTASIGYWSDVIFAKCVFFLAPLSLLAIIPAVIVCIQTESYFIFWFDVFCFVLLLFVGFVPGGSVKTRKKLLITLLFVTAFVLLTELGNYGPGLIYLLSVTVISLLLFPGKKNSLPFLLTLLFCIFYGFLIEYGLVAIATRHDNPLLEWVAMAANVLFLSALFTLIIPFFLSKLEKVLKEKNQLINSVQKSNEELNKVIEQVESKKLELEQFTFIASHDLQEPLHLIHNFMDKLKSSYEHQIDKKGQNYIRFASKEAIRMKQIIDGLLEFSQAGRPMELEDQVDLNQILLEFENSRKKLILEKHITLSYLPLPTIVSSKIALTSIFHALLDNAIKFSKEGHELHIRIVATNDRHSWLFAIQDNGIGIDPEFFEKIFILFQKLHSREEYSGSGIGLAIAKKNVKFLGGKIWLKSALGKGSTFFLKLPKIS